MMIQKSRSLTESYGGINKISKQSGLYLQPLIYQLSKKSPSRMTRKRCQNENENDLPQMLMEPILLYNNVRYLNFQSLRQESLPRMKMTLMILFHLHTRFEIASFLVKSQKKIRNDTLCGCSFCVLLAFSNAQDFFPVVNISSSNSFSLNSCLNARCG